MSCNMSAKTISNEIFRVVNTLSQQDVALNIVRALLHVAIFDSIMLRLGGILYSLITSLLRIFVPGEMP